MKRLIWLIICLPIALTTAIYGQTETTPQAGLSLATYQLPTIRNDFSNFKSNNYFQPVFDEQKSMPTLVLNKRQVAQNNLFYLLATTLSALEVGNFNNFGAIGLPSPAFDPLISDLSGPNDYLLLQQYEFERKNTLPVFIAAPKALQLRF